MNTSRSLPASAEPDARPSPDVILLVTTGCHYCEDARVELAARAEQGQLQLKVVTAESADGQVLQARHRPAMFPLVLIDGERFSVGRLPRRKLARFLARCEAF